MPVQNPQIKMFFIFAAIGSQMTAYSLLLKLRIGRTGLLSAVDAVMVGAGGLP